MREARQRPMDSGDEVIHIHNPGLTLAGVGIHIHIHIHNPVYTYTILDWIDTHSRIDSRRRRRSLSGARGPGGASARPQPSWDGGPGARQCVHDGMSSLQVHP